nr:MAG TPA: hypothetical protein [Caudoviricetes sp.]
MIGRCLWRALFGGGRVVFCGRDGVAFLYART